MLGVLKFTFASRAKKAILLSALIAIVLGTVAYVYVVSVQPQGGSRASITSPP